MQTNHLIFFPDTMLRYTVAVALWLWQVRKNVYMPPHPWNPDYSKMCSASPTVNQSETTESDKRTGVAVAVAS